VPLASNDAADPLDDTAAFYGDLQKGAAETSFYREMDANGTVYPSNRTISNVNFSMNSAPIGDEFKSFSLDLDFQGQIVHWQIAHAYGVQINILHAGVTQVQ